MTRDNCVGCEVDRGHILRTQLVGQAQGISLEGGMELQDRHGDLFVN